MKDKDDILDSCFMVRLNANDTFGYACADAHEVGLIGLMILKHIFPMFQEDGCVALMAHERGYHPLKEWQTPKYFKARKEIKKFIAGWKKKYPKMIGYYKEELKRKEEESNSEAGEKKGSENA